MAIIIIKIQSGAAEKAIGLNPDYVAGVEPDEYGRAKIYVNDMGRGVLTSVEPFETVVAQLNATGRR